MCYFTPNTAGALCAPIIPASKSRAVWSKLSIISGVMITSSPLEKSLHQRLHMQNSWGKAKSIFLEEETGALFCTCHTEKDKVLAPLVHIYLPIYDAHRIRRPEVCTRPSSTYREILP
mmetsp:Transcript_2870/g.4369  ORF Transcript_2870/g.4369 Transcript_2870/m.4369 type:complete len:118 (+) Transcript_2870:115-468(+)